MNQCYSEYLTWCIENKLFPVEKSQALWYLNIGAAWRYAWHYSDPNKYWVNEVYLPIIQQLGYTEEETNTIWGYYLTYGTLSKCKIIKSQEHRDKLSFLNR